MDSTKKFNFCCLDCSCGNNRNNFVIEMTEQEKEENDVKCPNDESKILKCLGYIPSWGVNKFNSMTPDQKQAVLTKRSREHYKKDIKEQKYVKNKELIEKFKG